MYSPTISAAANALSVTINSGAKLTFSGAYTLTIAASGLGVSNGGTIVLGSGSISGTNSSVNNTGSISIGGGTITDTGLRNGGALSGYGTLVGALTNSGTVSVSGGTLVDNSGISTSGSISIASGATLSSTGTVSETAGTISIAGGTLSGGSFAISSGASLTGYGTVSDTLSGAGTLTASGGTLTLTAAIPASSGLQFAIADSATSVLKLSGAVGDSNTVSFLGTHGALELNDVTISTDGLHFAGTVSGLDVASSATPTLSGIDYINVQGTVTKVAFTDSTHIQLWNNTTSLGTITLGAAVNTSTTYVDWQADSALSGNLGLGGTDVYLSSVVCFVTGTRILTAAGERRVETLRPGERVMVLAGEGQEERPIRWVGHRRIDLAAHPQPQMAAPVCVARDAFADGVPHADLLLSPDHAVFIDGRLIAVRQLVNGASIRRVEGLDAVEYWHLELDAHAVLLSEGLPVESYLDTGNRNWFDNGGEPLLLHPMMDVETGTETRVARSCAPFATEEAVVRPVWNRLAARAVALGQVLPEAVPATTEADLQLLAGERQVKPLYAENGLYLFVLRAGDQRLRLRSRSLVPAERWPWLDDRRRLGVAVAAVVLRGAEEVRRLALTGPEFGTGWWEAESGRRWTDGDALLTLPPHEGPCVLEVSVSATLPYEDAGSAKVARAA
jgi:hypothetical protein